MTTARERIYALTYGQEHNFSDDLIAAEWQADKNRLTYNIDKRIALHDELERLSESLSAVQQECDELRNEIARFEALVKRHEAALEWICSGEYTCWNHIDDHLYRVNCFCHPGVAPLAISPTPLEAIEAAMKRNS